MRVKIIVAFVILVFLTFGIGPIEEWAMCVTGAAGVATTQPGALVLHQPLKVDLRMTRSGGLDCFTNNTSNNYKNITCGYKVNDGKDWVVNNVNVVSDNKKEYIVECPIPAQDVAAKVEYYFEFSAFEQTAKRVSATLDVK